MKPQASPHPLVLSRGHGFSEKPIPRGIRALTPKAGSPKDPGISCQACCYADSSGICTFCFAHLPCCSKTSEEQALRSTNAVAPGKAEPSGEWGICKLGCTGCKGDTRNRSSLEGSPYAVQVICDEAQDAWGALSCRSQIGSAGVRGKVLLQPEANGSSGRLNNQQLLYGAQGLGGDLKDEVKAVSQCPFQTNMASTSFHEMTLHSSTPTQTARFICLKAMEVGVTERGPFGKSGGTGITPLSAAYSGVWGAALQADCVSNPRGILQAVLFSHAQSVLSAIELHALRHVLQLERTGPLEDEATQLVQALADPLSAEPLSASEHECLVGLLKRREVTSLPAARKHRLKSLLVRAFASSLFPEQQECAKSALLSAVHAPPMSPGGLSRLAAVLKGGCWGCTDVQAGIEEQLKPLCTLPQQQAIHRLLFLEGPWSLSLEERELLEALRVQLPAPSADQGLRVFTGSAQPQREESADSSVCESLHLLLQLMTATLTSDQRTHLFALLHIEESASGDTETGQPSVREEEHQVAPHLLSARLVTLMRRVLDGQRLTPAECRELQEGALQALEQLVPGEQLRALQRVIGVDDRATGSEENPGALRDMQLALTIREIPSAYLDQLDRRRLRGTLLQCLGRTLSSEKLWVLTRVLGELEHEGCQDQQAQASQSPPFALDASGGSGGCSWRGGLAEPAHIAQCKGEATELLGCACDVLEKLNDFFAADMQNADDPSHLQPAMTREGARLEGSSRALSPGINEEGDGQRPLDSLNFGVQAAKAQSELVPSELDEIVQASRGREGAVPSSYDRLCGVGPSTTGDSFLTHSGAPGPPDASASHVDDDRGGLHAKPTGEAAEEHAPVLGDPAVSKHVVGCIAPVQPGSLDPPKRGLRDVESKRALLQGLVREAVERKIFLDDLKIWRQQFRQRQELHQILKPFIAKIQTLQKGYLKRCPCLYHQQQDQLEDEERQANLELLDSLKCASFMRQERTAEDLADGVAWSISLDEASFPAEHQGAQDHAQQEDTAETESAPFESGSFGSSLRPLSGQKEKPLLPSRGRSMPLSSSRGSSSARKLQRGSASLGGAASSRESFEAARSISHTRSLGRTLRHGHSAGSRSTSVSPPQPRPSPTGGQSLSQLEFSFERSLRSSCVFAPAGKALEDKSVAVEEDKSSMQKRALEKGHQLAQDAKVASWIFLKKQVQPAKSALGPELVDMINLQHLNARTLPPGKGWQTRSLLRMVEGIVGLVCSLRGEEAGASLLSSLTTLAQQTRAEDCDLAIHAEVESARKALLLLDALPSSKPIAQEAKGGTAGAFETRVEKAQCVKSQLEISEANGNLESNIGKEAYSDAAQASRKEAPHEADNEGTHENNDTPRESKKKPLASKLSEKFKQAVLIERGQRRKNMAAASSKSTPKAKPTKNRRGPGAGKRESPSTPEGPRTFGEGSKWAA
ncbi:hypothetical protein Esti_004056 [Eimeria stiedai]